MITFFKNIINAIRRLFGWKNKEDDVGQGLQVWDENGVNILDTDNRITNILDIKKVTTATASITYTSSLFLTNDYFYIVSPNSLKLRAFPLKVNTILVGDTLTISVENNTENLYIYIGVY